MGEPGQSSPLKWILRRPLRRPGRVASILALSCCIAPLRIATVVAVLPILKILFKPSWVEELRAQAESLSPWLQPTAVKLVDTMAEIGGLHAMSYLFGAMLLLGLLRATLLVVQEWLASTLVHQAAEEIATEVHDALLAGAARNTAEGKVLSHFAADLDAVRIALRRVFGKVMREPFNLLVALAALFWMDVQLALVTALVFPPAAGLLLFLSRKLRSASRKALARAGNLMERVEEGLRGRRVVWSFGLEPRERQRFSATVVGLTDKLIQVDRQEALSAPLLELLGLAAAMVCSLIGASRVLDQDMTAEGFLTFYLMLVMLLDPLRKLADTQVRIQRGSAAAERLQALVASKPPRQPIAGHREMAPVQQSLRVEDVSVIGDDGSRILDHVSFTIQPGEAVLLAGPSGAGKSTLIDLIAGLRSPDEGRLWIDDTPIDEFTADSFRRHVALVPQATFLFRGSLRENITLGQPAGRVSAEQATEMAAIRLLLDGLPQGIETLAEEHALSAGERQRLSLARAFYRDPSVILLDEASSALDRPTEEKVIGSVLEQRAGRITLLVTHRLSADLDVDRILLLQEGQLLQQGTPDEMLRDSDLYRRLLEGRLVEEQAP